MLFDTDSRKYQAGCSCIANELSCQTKVCWSSRRGWMSFGEVGTCYLYNIRISFMYMYRRFGVSRLETETCYRTANLRRQVATGIFPRGNFVVVVLYKCRVPFGSEKPHTASSGVVLPRQNAGTAACSAAFHTKTTTISPVPVTVQTRPGVPNMINWHSNSSVDNSRCSNAQVYLKNASKFLEDSPQGVSVEDITGLWVASDDPSVIGEMQSLAQQYFPNVGPESVIWISGRTATKTSHEPRVATHSDDMASKMLVK